MNVQVDILIVRVRKIRQKDTSLKLKDFLQEENKSILQEFITIIFMILKRVNFIFDTIETK